MKQLLLFLTFCLQVLAVRAQEQISNFENQGFETPNGVQKVDTIHNKLFFFIKRADAGSTDLWVTNGKPGQTRLLTDSSGTTLDHNARAIRAHGYIYLIRDHIYRTQGEVLERVLSKSDSLYAFQGFNGRLLLYFDKRRHTDTGDLYYSHLNWLNADNTITRLADNVISYQIIDSTLHYLSINYKTGNFELCKLTMDGSIVRNVIYTVVAGLNIDRFTYFSENGHDFYFFDTSKGRKMVAKPAGSNQDLSLTDWGGNSYFPYRVTDTTGQVYFLHHFGDIKLFALQPDNSLKEKWSVSVRNIALGDGDIYGNGVAYRNFIVMGDKLVFQSTRGNEGINSFFLNVFNLNTGANKRSRNMVAHFMSNFLTPVVSEVDTNTYIIDNLVGKRVTYNFLKDTITNVENYPFAYPQSKDTLLTLGKETLLIKSNIYNITNGSKTTLLPTRTIYESWQTDQFAYRILGDKLIFWKYNPVSKQTEIWSGKGGRNDMQKIAVVSERFDYLKSWITERSGKLVFYAFSEAGRMCFFETDGTTAGTRKIYETPEPVELEDDPIWVNDRSVVVRLKAPESRGDLLILENGTVRRLQLDNLQRYDVYLTAGNIYLGVIRSTIRELLKVTSNRLLYVDRAYQSVKVYKDRIFYQKEFPPLSGNIYSLHTVDEAGNPLWVLDELISGWAIVGPKLVCSHFTNSVHYTSVIDLETMALEISKTAGAANSYKLWIDQTLILTRNNQLQLINGGRTSTYDLDFTPTNGLAAYGNGVLVLGAKDIAYYDLAARTATSVVRNKNYDSGLIYENARKSTNFLLMLIIEADNRRLWAQWSVKDKNTTFFDESYVSFQNVHPTGAFSLRPEGPALYWRFDGSRLKESYHMPDYNPLRFLWLNDVVYTSITGKETGTEFYQVAGNALRAYPELVKGPEGMEARTIFEYNRQLYVYAFTYTHGWQVWRMPEPVEMITGTEQPSAEPAGPVVYPNPVRDRLSIDIEKAWQYRLINTRGQLLRQGEISAQRGIDMSALPQGVYLIQLFDEQKVFVKKVIKE